MALRIVHAGHVVGRLRALPSEMRYSGVTGRAAAAAAIIWLRGLRGLPLVGPERPGKCDGGGDPGLGGATGSA